MVECLIDPFILPDPRCSQEGILITTERGVECKVPTYDPRITITPATGEYPTLTSCNIGETSKRVVAHRGFQEQPLGEITGI